MRLVQTASAYFRSFVVFAIGIALLAVVGVAWRRLSSRSQLSAPPPTSAAEQTPQATVLQATMVSHAVEPDKADFLLFPADSWKAADLRIEPVRKAPFHKSVELTGKISLNEDRIAHIFPLVDGRVDDVKIHLGDRVKKDDLLVVVQSTEVGRLMLQLYQNRMQHEFATTKDRWTQSVASHTRSMIQLMRTGAAIEEIEKQLADRPMGEYREKLMTAYIASYKARKNLERLKPLSGGGAVTGKQLLEAESEGDAARATLQSLLEQFQQETQQASALSTQAVKELATRVAVDETNLKILGFDDAALAQVDPVRQGETISHYPIQAPFDGAIVSKDVVLLERVGPENQILSVADLSTVWVTTDVYEDHLAMTASAKDVTIQLRSPAWPGKKFEAKIFYTGDLVQESTRTVAMRAIADNRDGFLKPGMFVNVDFPSVSRDDVTQAPLSAVLEHAGKSFVFVHLGGDRFQRRDVTLGMSNARSVEIVSGVSAGESVVVSGNFALKSRMLADLLSE